MPKLKLVSLLAATILSLSACAHDPVIVELELPPPQTYPTINAESMECLDDQTYEALVIRDVMKTERIKTLEDIIRSTHK